MFIGAGSTILCDTRIGDNVIIGASSVVTKDVPSNSVFAGNPAKYVCSFEEYQNKHVMNRKVSHIFSEYRWDEWINAPIEDKILMRKKLQEGAGYL